MTDDRDGINPPEEPDGGSGEGGRKLDEDAAWRAIIENYGDRAELEALNRPAPVEPMPPAEHRAEQAPVETPRWGDSLNTEATWDDEGHFIPPVPPPMPPVEPRRKLAWIGLFGAPVVMLAAVVFGWRFPDWLMGGLVAGFIGGFVYLVATMPRSRSDDGSGDDGAIV
jgi:hypothetical protein